MTFLEILHTILIGPLKLLFEIVFSISYRFVDNVGLSIVVLSLVMNLLALPLYTQADKLQKKTRDIEGKLKNDLDHIKKTFSGDERMMIIQAYYRQRKYSPLSAMNGSISLLLQIPFFMAAYQFLSGLDILENISFGPIENLAAPDGLLLIGGMVINVLPILMTAINIISGAMYLKGYLLKDKLQVYAMAGVFLVLLYNSPSCLVFYWTMNNVFSLVKNILLKLKNPKKIIFSICFVIGIIMLLFGLFCYNTYSSRRKIFVILLSLVLQIPIVLSAIKYPFKISFDKSYNKRLFLVASLFLTLFIGLYIPSVYIAASPQEYVNISYFYHPLWYILSTLCLSIGTFLVWLQIFYGLSTPKVKTIFDKIILIASVGAVVDYMFFGTNLGIISSTLRYDRGLSFTYQEQFINIFALCVVAIVVYLICEKKEKVFSSVMSVAIIAIICISSVNALAIKSSIENIEDYSSTPINFNLSRKGNNVVVLILDRAMGEYLPYILQEKPELMEQFEGFTYYNNTISFAGYTNMATPSIMGGYEYTPVEINKRDAELLKDKQNEALKVIPVLFSENGYEVTVCDPPHANYQWTPDLSIYDDYPKIKAYNPVGMFVDSIDKEAVVNSRMRNFFCFSVMKSMPLITQKTIYNDGGYNQASNMFSVVQLVEGLSKATGITSGLMEEYQVLSNLKNITTITEGDTNTYLFMHNETTHEPNILQTPNYEPADQVDNTEYDLINSDRFIIGEQVLNITTAEQMSSYHVNMASLLRIGEWLDYLKENDVYDNTRIIIVSDHGRGVGAVDELIDGNINKESYYPLFMVKDFNSCEFKVSDEFMTNADTAYLSVKGLIENPINPFTGNPIDISEKNAHEQYICMSNEWNISKNNGNTFIASSWASVKDNIWDKDNWIVYEGDYILKEHSAP